MFRTRRLLILPVVTLLFFATTACGDDEATTASPDDATLGAPAETEAPPTDVVDVCAAVTADEIGGLVNASVTVQEIPGGGCRFPQEDPRALALSIVPAPYTDDNGGLESSKFGTTAIIQGDAVDLEIGEGAFIVVGQALGGENQQGQGAVKVGGQLITCAGAQGVGMSAGDVGAIVTALMQLVAEKAA